MLTINNTMAVISSSFTKRTLDSVALDPSPCRAVLVEQEPTSMAPEGDVDELLAFMRQKEKEKLTKILDTEVPSGVLPLGYKGLLLDARVAARGADDFVYKKHSDLRQKVARGNTFLELTHQGTGHTVLMLMTYANKKFSGGPGDEDDSDNIQEDDYKRYLLSSQDVVQIVRTEKQNGEAAHVSGRYIDRTFVWCLGSKNVHMLVGAEADIDKYEGSRYDVCKMVARTAWRTLHDLPREKLKRLQRLLHDTRATLVAELLQPEYQHIVSLEHLKRKELSFFALTPTYSSSRNTSLTVKPPQETLELLKGLGLPTTSYKVLNGGLDALPTLMQEIRSGRNSEGEVLYLINVSKECVGLLKVKTAWYIHLRALREKGWRMAAQMSKNKGKTGILDNFKRYTVERLEAIKTWLNLTEKCTEAWKQIGGNWVKWLYPKLLAGELEQHRLRAKFPYIWNQFLQEEGIKDDISFETPCIPQDCAT